MVTLTGAPLPFTILTVAVAEKSYQGVAVRPHDLRRTFARLMHKGGAPIDQIQLSLGHSSIQTTERYLGVDQNVPSTPATRPRLHAPRAAD